jgi:hypothetical protein
VKRIFGVLILLLAFVVVGFSQDASHTSSLLNGVFWKAATPAAQLAWTEGFMEGAAIVLGLVDKSTPEDLDSGLTDVALVERITDFYAMPDTEKIPVLAALIYCNRQHLGESKEELKRFLDDLVSKANKPRDDQI